MKRIMVAVVSVLLLSVAGCSSDAPSTEAPTTTTPSTDTPSTEAPVTTTPSTSTPSTTTPGTPGTSTPRTTTPSTEAPATTTPATTSPSIPSSALSPTIRFVTFALDGTNIDTSILVEEGGLGRNDIVSVEFAYTKFGIETTVAATKASSSTMSSLWLVESLMLRVGDTVTIHAVDSRGSTDDTTVTVELSTSMG